MNNVHPVWLHAILLTLVAIHLGGCETTPSALRKGAPLSLAAEVSMQLPPPPIADEASRLSLWATHYSVHRATAKSTGIALILHDGSSSEERISHKDWCSAALEGTVVIASDRRSAVYNHFDHRGPQQRSCRDFYPTLKASTNRRMSRSRFMRSRSIYGHGVRGMSLVPFRSIAVDPTVIPIGSVVYVPQARGLKLPTTQGKTLVHDGYFFAADIGSAISGSHIDIFGGHSSNNPIPELIHSHPSKRFAAYVVNNQQLQDILGKRHHDVAF